MQRDIMLATRIAALNAACEGLLDWYRNKELIQALLYKLTTMPLDTPEMIKEAEGDIVALKCLLVFMHDLDIEYDSNDQGAWTEKLRKSVYLRSEFGEILKEMFADEPDDRRREKLSWVEGSVGIVESVTPYEDGGASISCKGFGFGIRGSDYGYPVEVGDRVLVWGETGRPIRGVDVSKPWSGDPDSGLPSVPDWHEVFFKTEAEMEAEHRKMASDMQAQRLKEFEENKEKLDAQYESLPSCFQRRVDRFRRNNPDFRWEFEPYELFCCTEAVKMADNATNAVGEGTDTAEVDDFWADEAKWLKAYPKMSKDDIPEDSSVRWLFWASALNSAAYDYDYQRHERVLGISEGHSGNTFGCALRLASWWLQGNEEAIEKSHGALAPLVGSKAYGCVPRDSEEGEPVDA